MRTPVVEHHGLIGASVSRFASIFAAAGRAALFANHGEDVTRYPLGVVGSADVMTGLFVESASSQDTSRGESNSRSGQLRVSSDETVDPRDTWLIRGEVWETLSVSDDSSGVKRLSLRKNERQRTSTIGGR